MIKYYNRNTKKYEIERVAGDKYLNWTYSSPIGMKFLELLIKKKFFSKIYGSFCDSKRSINKIYSFINDFNIDMSLCEKNINEFKSFNDFFIRKLKKEARPIDTDLTSLVSPGDGRLLAYENIDLEKIIQVKGYTYNLDNLINNADVSEKFSEGTCLILRLAPVDYHRFHFIDDGICERTNEVNGEYYSVNPVALQKIPELFCRNKRQWSIFHSDNFGDILYVEVGATCVGSIIQTYSPENRIKKGAEKGYFKFGGSTVILFFQKNRVKIDQDIIDNTNQGYESKVLIGEKIGKKS